MNISGMSTTEWVEGIFGGRFPRDKVARKEWFRRLRQARQRIPGELESEREQRLFNEFGEKANGRIHKYESQISSRLRRIEIGHEVRARQSGVPWDIVDIYALYLANDRRCGICGDPVPLEVVAFDHIQPISRGGGHVRENLQPAHLACNSAKGDRWL